MTMLEKIQSQLENLSKSERKVAATILVAPGSIIQTSIARPAHEAGVSQPTVNRFCHRLETKGFPDFKLRLAQSLAASGTHWVNLDIDENDSVEAYSGKIFESAIADLERIRSTLDTATISRAVDILTQAKKIAFFALGASAAIAHDAMNKFFRFNVPVICSDDIVMQRINCINCTQGDVIVLISQTGRNKNYVELAQLARENDAIVLAITSPGSRLASEASLALNVDVPAKTGIFMPGASKVTQMMLTDVLATGFTLRCSAKFRDNLRRVMDTQEASPSGREDATACSEPEGVDCLADQQNTARIL